jgi:hypothetical protein
LCMFFATFKGSREKKKELPFFLSSCITIRRFTPISAAPGWRGQESTVFRALAHVPVAQRRRLLRTPDTSLQGEERFLSITTIVARHIFVSLRHS